MAPKIDDVAASGTDDDDDDDDGGGTGIGVVLTVPVGVAGPTLPVGVLAGVKVGKLWAKV